MRWPWRRAVPPAAVVPATVAPSRLVRWRDNVGGGLLMAAEFAATAGAGIGAPLAFASGKWLLAGVLALVAVGMLLRVLRRRQRARAAPAGEGAAGDPAWAVLGAGLLATVEAAVLVEATLLPVRYNQPGFTPWNWAWVMGAWLLLFVLQRHGLTLARHRAGHWLRRRRTPDNPTPPRQPG